jgi:hypothetical protein
MAILEGLHSEPQEEFLYRKEIIAEYKHSVSLMAFGCMVRGTAGVISFSAE